MSGEGFPVAVVVKNLPVSAGDIRGAGSIPRSGRSSGEGNDSPLQYSYLENPMDRGAWRTIVHNIIKSCSQLKHRGTCVHTGCKCRIFCLFWSTLVI